MIEIQGLHNSALCYTPALEPTAELQIKTVCDQEAFAGCKIRIMPDVHAGKGCTIGTTMTIRDKIVPGMVGVDIGCGMETVRLAEKEIDFAALDALIRKEIPCGQNIRKDEHPLNGEIDLHRLRCSPYVSVERAKRSIGTLGGGNHFIELQEDQDGYLGIMIHSGSRHFGKEICDYFHKRARELNAAWHSAVPDSYHLAFLPVDSAEGQDYILWMNLALEYAFENRKRMMEKTLEIVAEKVEKYLDTTMEFTEHINCHHNYASLETHYGKEVWVHRKGATRAGNGEMAVIPGAMGSYSYVVMGKGNPESFESSSHGAGRAYSRKAAMEKFSCEEVINDLKAQGVVLGKMKKSDVAEESRFAYKDIDHVMDQQKDLVVPVKKLKTVGVVKG